RNGDEDRTCGSQRELDGDVRLLGRDYKIPDGRHRVVRTGRGSRSLAQVKVDPQDIGTVRGCEIPRAKIEPGVGREGGRGDDPLWNEVAALNDRARGHIHPYYYESVSTGYTTE